MHNVIRIPHYSPRLLSNECIVHVFSFLDSQSSNRLRFTQKVSQLLRYSFFFLLVHASQEVSCHLINLIAEAGRCFETGKTIIWDASKGSL